MNDLFYTGILEIQKLHYKVSKLPLYKQLLSAILAGIFIGLAAYSSLFTASYFFLNKYYEIGKFVSAIVFPVGLVLVCVLGTNLFTGNCLSCISIPLKNSIKLLLTSWFGNLIGIILLSHVLPIPQIYHSFTDLAQTKASLQLQNAFILGIFCNILVCTGIVFYKISNSIAKLWIPIFLFVLCGFEHSIADMFYLYFGMFNNIDLNALCVLIVITLGNIFGGILLKIYGLINRKPKSYP